MHKFYKKRPIDEIKTRKNYFGLLTTIVSLLTLLVLLYQGIVLHNQTKLLTDSFTLSIKPTLALSAERILLIQGIEADSVVATSDIKLQNIGNDILFYIGSLHYGLNNKIHITSDNHITLIDSLGLSASNFDTRYDDMRLKHLVKQDTTTVKTTWVTSKSNEYYLYAFYFYKDQKNNYYDSVLYCHVILNENNEETYLKYNQYFSSLTKKDTKRLTSLLKKHPMGEYF